MAETAIETLKAQIAVAKTERESAHGKIKHLAGLLDAAYADQKARADRLNDLTAAVARLEEKPTPNADPTIEIPVGGYAYRIRCPEGEPPPHIVIKGVEPGRAYDIRADMVADAPASFSTWSGKPVTKQETPLEAADREAAAAEGVELKAGDRLLLMGQSGERQTRGMDPLVAEEILKDHLRDVAKDHDDECRPVRDPYTRDSIVDAIGAAFVKNELPGTSARTLIDLVDAAFGRKS